MQIFSYSHNIEITKNSRGDLIKDIFNNRGIFPINHLKTENRQFIGDFTFRNKNGQSQVDFVSVTTVDTVKCFNIMPEGLTISDHKILNCSINVSKIITNNR